MKNRGQIFLEFLLLMLTLVSISFLILRICNTLIASRWIALVRIMTEAPASDIKFR